MTKNIFLIFNIKVWLLLRWLLLGWLLLDNFDHLIVILLTLGKSRNIVILLTLGKSKNVVILLTLGKSKNIFILPTLGRLPPFPTQSVMLPLVTYP